MKRYALQCRFREWEPWQLWREFDTLQEAQEAYRALPDKKFYRFAEAYVQVRYKALKV